MNHFESLGSLLLIVLGLGFWAAMRSNQSDDNLLTSELSDSQSIDRESIPDPAQEEEIQAPSIVDAVDESTSELFDESVNLPDQPLESAPDLASDSAPNLSAAAQPTLPSSIAPTVIPIAEQTAFNLDTFKQTFIDNLLQLQGRSLQSATIQDCYATLTAMVQQRLLQLRHPVLSLASPGVRIIGEIATEVWVSSPLETNLINLGIHHSVEQSLRELGINLNTLVNLEAASLGEGNLGSLIGDYLEALATANLPAIGYGNRRSVSRAGQTYSGKTYSWEVARPEASVTVKFGGETQVYTGTEGRLRVRWTPQITVKGIPYDTFIPGYGSNTVNILRFWQLESSDSLPEYSLDISQNLSHSQPEVQPQSEEQRLRERFFLTSCAIQDVIWLHEQGGESIETLHERFALQLNDTAPALAIVELMHWLVDEYELEWDQAWAITQGVFSCTFHSWMPDLAPFQSGSPQAGNSQSDDRWSIEVFRRLLPRHLEILYEINRRFLQEAEDRYPNDHERMRRMSLIDESGDRYVRVAHLACLGSYALIGTSPWHSHLLQRTAWSDFSALYPGKFSSIINGTNLRRCLVQGNPQLTHLLTQWIGEDWITQPQQLKHLEELTQNQQFCGEWWQVRRTVKQNVACLIHQKTGIEININSLFDVQIAPVSMYQRQLLNLLHIITLYVRLKSNATTDTIQHFTHRSVPRTCIFAGRLMPNHPFAESIAHLIHAVADTINRDPEVQGKLQVIVLTNIQDSQLVRQLWAAADLAEYIPPAGQVAPYPAPFPFALNGAIVLGSFDSINLELQQAVGAKNCFLFGRNAAEVSHLYQQGYNPLSYYSRIPDLQQSIKPIAAGYFSDGDTRVFQDLGNWLLSQDSALVLAEYSAYMDCQERVSQSYQDQKQWTRMSILTTARTGHFTSDRTIQHYQNLWYRG